MNKVKSIISAVLIITTTFLLASQNIFANNMLSNNTNTANVMKSSIFSDVPTNHWAYAPIIKMNEKGIINGASKGKYNPNGYLTNAEIMTMIINLSKLYVTKPINQVKASPYKDVTSKDWFNSSVITGYNLGLLENAEKFNPQEKVDRETAIYRLGKLLNAVYDKNGKSYLSLYTQNEVLIKPIYEAKNKVLFADESKIKDAMTIKQMTLAGIISGKQNPDKKNKLPLFDPKGKLTRAEAAVLMYRYTEFLNSILITENTSLNVNGINFVVNHKGYDLTVSVDMTNSSTSGLLYKLAKSVKTKNLQNTDIVNNRNLLKEVKSNHSEVVKSYLGTNQGVMITSQDVSIPADFDPRKQQWYKESMKKPGQMVISPSYKDPMKNINIVTVSITTEDGNGVIGIEMPENQIKDYIVDITNVKVNGNIISIQYKTVPSVEYIFNSPVQANPIDKFTTKVENQKYQYTVEQVK